MKKSNLFNILCSLLVGVLFIIALMLVFIASGMVTLTKVELVFSTESARARYDGEPLTNEIWAIKSGSLKEGHRAVVTVTGSQTSVGESDNTIQVRILDSADADVTSDYNISYDLGTLKVTPRTVTITSNSAEKLYDGKPLTDSGYTVSEDLVDGHKELVIVTGSITKVGSVFNTISAVIITDEYGEDVSENYKMVIREGTLRVTDTANTSSDSDEVLYSVYSDYTGYIYLRGKSFGNYNGKTWEDAPVYQYLISDKFAASYLTSYALRNAGASKYHVAIKPVSGTYVLPYYMDMDDTSGYVYQSDDTVNSGKYQQYELDFYLYDKTPVQSNTFVKFYEEPYRAFVKENYLYVDKETYAFMEAIIEEEGFSASDPDIIEKVAEYIQNSAEYDLKYDTALDREDNVVIAFLRDYKTGVCRHYASAATLLYRALGIPARYTTGVVASAQAGKWVSVKQSESHAWVEVYIDSVGWKQVEVTGGGGFGEDNGTRLSLAPTTVEKKYDGTPLTAAQTVKGFEKYEAQGYTYKAVISGVQTEIGIGKSKIESIEIFAPNGKNVTSDFNLILSEGKMHVYAEELTFTSADYTLAYGENLPNDIVKTQGEFVSPTHTFTSVSTADLSAGTHLNLFNISITDQNGEDITYYYKINRIYGVLKISRAQITIKAGDAEKKYDGTPLTCEEIEVAAGKLLPGEAIEIFETEGSQIYVGVAENIVTSVVIYNASGQDVTKNYEIKLISGTLTVTP